MAASAASLSWEVLEESVEFNYDGKRNDDSPTETFNEGGDHR
jgi:hypothetical protein